MKREKIKRDVNRPSDNVMVPQELFLSNVVLCTCIHMHMYSLENITWSELGKQTIKNLLKIHSRQLKLERYKFSTSSFLIDQTKTSSGKGGHFV